MLGWLFAALVVLGLLAIGVVGLIAPGSASAQYGIVLDDPRALGLVRAMAARDLVIGGLLALVALGGSRAALGWGTCLTALIAVVDLAVVTADGRAPGGRARTLHASGIVGLLVAGAVLLAGY
jgi:hypothetical protein